MEGGGDGPEQIAVPQGGEDVADAVPTDERPEMDPLFEWSFRRSKLGTFLFLVVGVGLAGAMKWYGTAGNEAPAWLWPIWVVFLVPLLFSTVWRAGRWLSLRRPIDPALHTSEHRPEVDDDR